MASLWEWVFPVGFKTQRALSRTLSASARKYIEQLSSVLDSLAAIHALGGKARRLARSAKRLLEAQRFSEAANVFEKIAALQKAQAQACTHAAAASFAAAASCQFTAGDARKAAKLTRVAVRPYIRRKAREASRSSKT